jgi:pilin isopeptide linkage protein
MKKSKKILSMLLAATMISSLGTVTAFAGDGDTPAVNTDGKYTFSELTDGRLTFTKVLEVNNTTDKITGTTFEFKMTGSSDGNGTATADGVEIHTGIGTIENAKVEFTGKETAAETAISTVPGYVAAEGQENFIGATKSGTFDLSGLSFTDKENGIYRYTVEEIPDEDNASIRYDEKTFTVDLYVSDGAIQYVQAKNAQTGNKTPIVFQNAVKSSSLKIVKNVTGQMADATKDFTFEIKIPKTGDNINLDDTINATKHTAESKTETVAITVSDDNYTSFTLKAGESLEITGIPEGMVYYVKEVANDISNKYQTKIEVCGDGETLSDTDDRDNYSITGKDAGKRLTSGSSNTVYFLNIKDMPSNTGIVLDIMPYAVVVLLAAGCAVLLIAKKRRNAR